LCSNFNNILKSILNDSQHFVHDEEISEMDGNELRLKAIKKDVSVFNSSLITITMFL